MADVFDVGAYILREIGPVPSRKLQKLVYYAHAWSLALRGQFLFSEPVEAWREGPVVRRLYEAHQGEKAPIAALRDGNPEAISEAERGIVDAVLVVYGGEDAEALVERTHGEKPWKKARHGIPNTEPSSERIDAESMARFYSRCSERLLIDAAMRLLPITKLRRSSVEGSHGVTERAEAAASEMLRDRAALPTDDTEDWVHRMTERLAGADD